MRRRIPSLTHPGVMTASELEASLRADLQALRTDLGRVWDLPPEDRHRLEAALPSTAIALIMLDEILIRRTEWRQTQHLSLDNARSPDSDALSSWVNKSLRPRLHDDPDQFRSASSLESLVHQLTPDLDIATPAEVLQARRNAEARALLLKEFGALTSAQVADMLGSEAKNRSSLAHRRRKEGRLLAVSYKGAVWYPGFQFHDGEVLPVIAEVLTEFAGAGMGDWEAALWFTAPNGWLDDARPVLLLLDEPSRVVEAARHEVVDLGG